MLPPESVRELPELALRPGALRFLADALPWQRSLRRDAGVRDRRLFWLGGLLGLFITVLELAGFALGMKPYRVPRPAHPTQAIQVALIDPLHETPPPPPEPEAPIVVRASRIALEPPKVEDKPPPARHAEASDAMRARMGAGATRATPRLFNPDGSVRLATPDLVAPPAAPATEREAARRGWARIEERGNPLDCKKTRFASAYAPDMSVGDRIAGKYLKWIGLADPQAIGHRAAKRAESGGCEPAD